MSEEVSHICPSRRETLAALGVAAFACSFDTLDLHPACGDDETMLSVVESVVSGAVAAVGGCPVLAGHVCTLHSPFLRIEGVQPPTALLGSDAVAIEGAERRNTAERDGVQSVAGLSRPKVPGELSLTLVARAIDRPTFVTDLLVELSPLAQLRGENAECTERFALYAAASHTPNIRDVILFPTLRSE